MKTNYTIREIKDNEKYILEGLLYEAIFQLPGSPPLPKDIIYNPELYIYIEKFGDKKDDFCLVAESDGKILGAVWIRLLDGEIKAYGNIDNETPEFSISLFPEYRGKGIGTELMRNMIAHLIDKGYTKASLSVSKQNRACRMYTRLGFRIIDEREDDYLMILELDKVDSRL